MSLFLVGFRPFFVLAFVAAVVLPLAWVQIYTGRLALPEGALPPVMWHAHEMIFAFGWAVLGGFLLTASKNWVKIRGLHGRPLAVAVVFWLVERCAVLYSGALPGWLRWPLLAAFPLFVGGYVVYTLVRYRKQDSFRDNAFFVVALPLFLVAKALLLTPETLVTGWTLALGLFRVAFVVMFERTFPPFMKAAANVELPRLPPLDFAIKALMLAAAFHALLPPRAAAALLLATALALAVRFTRWRPLTGLAHFPVAVMYVGYLGLIAHLVLEALRLEGVALGLGAVATHTFAFLCLGVVVAAMMIRISQGHTGRPLRFAASDRVGIAVLGAGAFFRLAAPQLWPAHYLAWLTLAAAGWALCYALLGVRLVPFLFRARVDQKEH
ncbi:MAG: NnrS family protein [Archangiaceae bacterium]|nr:NnrS family protein [Archangiaceae bacterium]